jgi:hypothetical protein
VCSAAPSLAAHEAGGARPLAGQHGIVEFIFVAIGSLVSEVLERLLLLVEVLGSKCVVLDGGLVYGGGMAGW